MNLSGQRGGHPTGLPVNLKHRIDGGRRRGVKSGQHVANQARYIEETEPSFKEGGHRYLVGSIENGRLGAPRDQGLAGKVKVTGLGLPSELAGYVQKGIVPKFAIWNPIDLGYSTLQVAAHLARGGALAQPMAAGRMGSISFAADGVGAMSKPFIYDASNVAEFARIF